MTHHVIEAYRVDIDTRTNADGNQRTFPDGYKVNAHEITAGAVYKDENVTVTAFATKHAMESYGYRFDTPDRSIVISGDTNPAQATIDACRGCDVLIHEVHTSAWLAARPEAGGAPPGTFRRFSEKYHTTTEQLAELARQAKPRLLILYHYNSSDARGTTGGDDETLCRPLRHRPGSRCLLTFRGIASRPPQPSVGAVTRQAGPPAR